MLWEVMKWGEVLLQIWNLAAAYHHEGQLLMGYRREVQCDMDMLWGEGTLEGRRAGERW